MALFGLDRDCYWFMSDEEYLMAKKYVEEYGNPFGDDVQSDSNVGEFRTRDSHSVSASPVIAKKEAGLALREAGWSEDEISRQLGDWEVGC